MYQEYIQMRLSNQINLGWFYQFYIQEFPKYGDTYMHVIKDIFGNVHSQEERKREQANFQQFAQAFSLYIQTGVAKEVFDYVDKIMGVSKIEDEQGKLIYIA